MASQKFWVGCAGVCASAMLKEYFIGQADNKALVSQALRMAVKYDGPFWTKLNTNVK